MKRIKLPTVIRGRRSADAEAHYQAEVRRFCDGIEELASRLSFAVSARGWCYILEEHGLAKGDFNRAERLINQCRKDGLLPRNICATDASREAIVSAFANDDDPVYSIDEAVSADLLNIAEARETAISRAGRVYLPSGFYRDLPCYCEMMVEKIDLKELFKPICERFYVPLANAKGWADINSRCNMMERFAMMEAAGKQCVLLYCGDHDPAGLKISDSIRSNLAECEKAAGWSHENLIIDRLGLNADFIAANGLTWIDGLETGSGGNLVDPRHPHHRREDVQDYIRRFGPRKVEANALVVRPKAGRKLCLEAITKYIPADAPARWNEATRTARADVRRLVLERLAEAEAAP